MKNIHLLPTDKPSRLFDDGIELYLGELKDRKGHPATNYDTYITSDEYKQRGDWVIYKDKIVKLEVGDNELFYLGKKIIMTTDQDLIKDGVQTIPDDFLEWFVKNPNYEEIEVEQPFNPSSIAYGINTNPYKIIIPKEEPKQKTLEEDFISYKLAEKLFEEIYGNKPEILEGSQQHELTVAALQKGMVYGAKWQQENSCEHNYILTTEQGHRVIKCLKCNNTQPI